MRAPPSSNRDDLPPPNAIALWVRASPYEFRGHDLVPSNSLTNTLLDGSSTGFISWIFSLYSESLVFKGSTHSPVEHTTVFLKKRARRQHLHMKSFPLPSSLMISLSLGLHSLSSTWCSSFSWAVSFLPVLIYVLRSQPMKHLNLALDKTRVTETSGNGVLCWVPGWRVWNSADHEF